MRRTTVPGIMKSLRRLVAPLLAAGLSAVAAAPAGAQEAADTDVLQEYRITAYPNYRIADQWNGFAYLGYVYKPDAGYKAYYLGKGAIWQAKPWLQLWGGVIGVYTNQYDASNLLEIRPFVGVKFMGQNARKWNYYNWTRYEMRLTETLNTDEWSTVHRVRNQTRFEVPLAPLARAWTPRTAYAFCDVEPIYRSDNQNIDPLRLRLGLGYVASNHLLVEFQYFAQWTRPGGGSLTYTDNIWRLNFKLLGRGGLGTRLLSGGD